MTVSRRVFARLLAFAGIATTARAQNSAATVAVPTEVDARVRWVLGKYGARLDEHERADVQRLIASGQSSIDAMRAYPLDNAVEPATIFRVWRRR